jgi:hypothetical protein
MFINMLIAGKRDFVGNAVNVLLDIITEKPFKRSVLAKPPVLFALIGVGLAIIGLPE